MVSGLYDAVSSGDRTKALTELRDVLARQIDESPPQYVAALSKQLADVLQQLDALQPKKEASAVDDLASRRAARRAKAADPEPADESDVGGGGRD